MIDILQEIYFILTFIFKYKSILISILLYIIYKSLQKLVPKIPFDPINLDLKDFKGNDIYIIINHFDGHNYFLTLKVDKFNAKTGEGVVISHLDYTDHEISINKKDIPFTDVFKIIFTDFKIKYRILKSDYKLKLSKKTNSSLLSLLTNLKIIN